MPHSAEPCSAKEEDHGDAFSSAGVMPHVSYARETLLASAVGSSDVARGHKDDEAVPSFAHKQSSKGHRGQCCVNFSGPSEPTGVGKGTTAKVHCLA